MNLTEIITSFMESSVHWEFYAPDVVTVVIYNEIYLHRAIYPRFVVQESEICTFMEKLRNRWGFLPNGQRIQLMYLKPNPSRINSFHWIAIELKKYGDQLSLILFDSIDADTITWFGCIDETQQVVDFFYADHPKTELLEFQIIQHDEKNCAGFALDTLFRMEMISDLHEAVLLQTERISSSECMMTQDRARNVVVKLGAIRLRNIQNYGFISKKMESLKPIYRTTFGKNGQTLISYWQDHKRRKILSNSRTTEYYNDGIRHKKNSWKEKVVTNGFLSYLTSHPAIYNKMIKNRAGIEFLDSGVSQDIVFLSYDSTSC